MASTYSSTSDIDLFTGILSEEPLPGALVGRRTPGSNAQTGQTDWTD